MKISSAEFIAGAADAGGLLKTDLHQIAVVGKSNVGKSSFINYFANDGKLARVSKQPGRTKMINYFLINKQFILADLPGYGYAEVSKTEKARWADLIEHYLNNEPQLCYVVFLVDIRHDPTTDDLIMYNFLFKTNVPYLIVATKADKIPRSQIAAKKHRLAGFFRVGAENILPISSQAKTGMEQVYQKIDNILSYADSIIEVE